MKIMCFFDYTNITKKCQKIHNIKFMLKKTKKVFFINLYSIIYNNYIMLYKFC